MSMNVSKSPKMGDPFFEILAVHRVWLSTLEASQILGISPNALRILVCRGKVKFYKLGRHLRFRKEDLESLLKKGT